MMELAFSGGGAMGAFQWGAYRNLESNGYEFSEISGISAGALNAYLVACQDPVFGDKVWEQLMPGMLTKWNLLAAPFRALRGADGLLSNKRAAKMIKHVTLDRLKRPFYFQVLSLRSGQVITLKSSFFYNDKDFQNALLASMSWVPVLPPVKFGDVIWVDAGSRNPIPPRQTIGGRLVILTRPVIGVRSESTWLRNWVRSEEIEAYERVANDLTKEDHIIRPLEANPMWDFSRKSIIDNIYHGRFQARSYRDQQQNAV